MLKRIKNIVLNAIMGANLLTVVMMLASGYSDRLNPVEHATLACAGMFFPFFLVANLLFVVLWVVVAWRRVWLPIAGMALAFAPIRTYVPLRTLQQPPEGSIKVMSYNVCGYQQENAFELISQYVREQAPDILCLQEDMNPKHHLMEAAADVFAHSDTVHVSTSQKLPNAVGIYTRYPIVGKEKVVSDSKSNGAVAFFLRMDDGDTLLVINNHLESTNMSRDDRARYKTVLKGGMQRDSAEAETRLLLHKLGGQMAVRAPQADKVHRYIESHRRLPTIVCGDFNDTPISYTHYTISRGLTDCFAASGCGLGLSYNQKGFFFRIDNIMCSEHFRPYSCQVDNKMAASDHYPILCWLKKVEKP